MPAVAEAVTVWILRVLDVADSIDLDAARACVASRAATRGATRILGPERHPGGGVELSTRPVDVEMPPVEVDGLSLQTSVRLFDFGVASVRLRLALSEECTADALIALAARLEAMAALDDAARSTWERLALEIAPGLRGAHAVDLVEDYTVFTAARVRGCADGADAVAALDPARLLLAEPSRALASEVIASYRDRLVRYYAADAAVIGWSGALVIDPDGDFDTLEVLEVANARLLELRYYDRLLTRELARVYAAAESARGVSTLRALFRSPWVAVTRRAATLLVEVGQIHDRLEGALTLVGDAHTTRLYREAALRLRIAEISDAVRDKLGSLARVTEVFEAELTHRRGVALESTVVLLIVLEVVLGLLRPH